MSENTERGYEEKSFGEVFSRPNFCYEIPFFQRGYVWNKVNWNELLKEVILEEICGFEELPLRDQINKLENGCDEQIKDGNYYYGTIYLKEKEASKPTKPGTPRRYLIIDGQQRLITIYLFLIKLYHDLDAVKGYENKISQYSGDLFNNQIDGNNKSKIYTFKQDLKDLFEIVANNHNFNANLRGGISDFHKWYQKNISKISPECKYNLFSIIRTTLKITEIVLSNKDDEMLIFENLNDKGTPLRGDELLCSYIFKPIIEEKGYSEENVKELHSEKWIKSYEEVQRLQIDNIGRKIGTHERYLFFLRTILSIGKNRMIGKDRDIYYTFKKEYRNPKSKDMERELEEIRAWVPFFERALFPKKNPLKNDPGKKIQNLLSDIDDLKVYTTLTFIMPLLKEFDQKESFAEECVQILHTLYVCLIRHGISGSPKTKYNIIFPGLWTSIKDGNNKIALMKERFRKESLFVSDTDLKERFRSADVYKASYKWHILEKIDRYLCKDLLRSEFPDYASLPDVEHICPKNHEKAWKEYLGSEYSAEDLDRRLDTIGNLMLVGKSRNSELSDKIFPEKLKSYDSNSGLSKHLKENYSQEKWNLETIEKRSEALAETACKVWNWDL